MYLWMMRLAKAMAVLGGLVLLSMVALVCLSIAGRAANGALHGALGEAFPWVSKWALDFGVGPINGDFELVESGVAFAIFAFLPLCQITRGHASVDIFTRFFSDRINRTLTMAIDCVFAGVLVLIAVQLEAGMQSKLRSGQTTFLIQFPIWWSYAASLTGAIVAAVVAAYIAALRIAEVVTGRVLLPFEDWT